MKKNRQTQLSPAAMAAFRALTSDRENLQLRERLLAAENRAFQLELHRDYGNPGERLQLDRSGGLARIPAAPAGGGAARKAAK